MECVFVVAIVASFLAQKLRASYQDKNERLYTHQIVHRRVDPIRAPDFGFRFPKTRERAASGIHKPQPIVPNALTGTTCCGLGSSILLFHLCTSMQFLVCRKMLSHNGLWLVLSSSNDSV